MSCKHEYLQLFSEYGFDNTVIFECMKCGRHISMKKELNPVNKILGDVK